MDMNKGIAAVEASEMGKWEARAGKHYEQGRQSLNISAQQRSAPSTGKKLGQ